MQTRIDEFRALDTVVMTISVDDVEHNLEIAETYAPDLLLLSDPDFGAIDAYGVRHVGGGLDGDVARPATFLIDREGRIVSRHLTENWRVRPRPAELLAELSRM